MNGTRDSAAQYSAVRLHGISPRYRFTARNAFISARVVGVHLYYTPHTHPTHRVALSGFLCDNELLVMAGVSVAEVMHGASEDKDEIEFHKVQASMCSGDITYSPPVIFIIF